MPNQNNLDQPTPANNIYLFMLSIISSAVLLFLMRDLNWLASTIYEPGAPDGWEPHPQDTWAKLTQIEKDMNYKLTDPNSQRADELKRYVLLGAAPEVVKSAIETNGVRFFSAPYASSSTTIGGGDIISVYIAMNELAHPTLIRFHTQNEWFHLSLRLARHKRPSPNKKERSGLHPDEAKRMRKAIKKDEAEIKALKTLFKPCCEDESCILTDANTNEKQKKFLDGVEDFVPPIHTFKLTIPESRVAAAYKRTPNGDYIIPAGTPSSSGKQKSPVPVYWTIKKQPDKNKVVHASVMQNNSNQLSEKACAFFAHKKMRDASYQPGGPYYDLPDNIKIEDKGSDIASLPAKAKLAVYPNFCKEYDNILGIEGACNTPDALDTPEMR